MKQHLGLLGYLVTDPVTRRQGVVVSISFDLNGCVQAYITPQLDKSGKLPDGFWIDTKRLVRGKPVATEVPTFESIPGGRALPAPSSKAAP